MGLTDMLGWAWYLLLLRDQIERQMCKDLTPGEIEAVMEKTKVWNKYHCPFCDCSPCEMLTRSCRGHEYPRVARAM